MHGRVRVLTLLLVAAGGGLGSAALAATGSGAPQGLLHADAPALAVLIGWSFAGTGVVAWALRPQNRFGLLLYVTGVTWFSSALMTSGSPVWFTLGVLTAPWWLGVFSHALHAFPAGRLEGRLSRMLVALLYVDVTAVQAVRLLFTSSNDLPGCAGCPANLLLVSERPDVAVRLLVVQQAGVGSVVIVGTLLVLASRWRTATPALRRVLVPVLATGAVCLMVQAVSLLAQPGSVRQSVGWVGAVAFAAVPASFLLGLLRQRMDRAAVGRLVVDLGGVQEGDPLDRLLRTALKDPSLTVAYWREETREYLDAAGHRYPMPAPGEGRTVTVVERQGRRIAALVHDTSVAENPALVSGAVAAAGLALENARLHAEVRAQLEELRASRRRLVEAGDRERRRLERNLHDGAQQRLLAVSLLLSELEHGPGTDTWGSKLVGEARAELGRSMSELRELAMGLHPAVLMDHGLAVALEGLAARTPIPVKLVVDLRLRPSPAVEVAAYYLVSEALANAVKHAAAHEVAVHVHTVREDGATAVSVKVTDDGVGGAAPQGGSGLQGLRDRVAVLDGRLDISSPPGEGTTVKAVIPCA